MLQKRMFKVLSPVAKRNGAGTWWMRVGSAFTNQDQSINVYLDAVPKEYTFQLRELDDRDLRQRTLTTSSEPPAGGSLGSDALNHTTF